MILWLIVYLFIYLFCLNIVLSIYKIIELYNLNLGFKLLSITIDHYRQKKSLSLSLSLSVKISLSLIPGLYIRITEYHAREQRSWGGHMGWEENMIVWMHASIRYTLAHMGLDITNTNNVKREQRSWGGHMGWEK